MRSAKELRRRALRGATYRRRLGGRRGVTDVPLELLVIVIILAIVVPIIIAALVAYTGAQEKLNVSEQADSVRDTAVQSFDDGINTTLLVTVSVPANANLIVGASLFLRGGYLNAQASYVTYGVGVSPNTCWQNLPNSETCVLVDNGAADILMTNVTCSGVWPNIVYSYNPFIVTAGVTETLALTKIAPGAFLCGVAPPTNETAGFVEVQPGV
jgi:hypothetical protein